MSARATEPNLAFAWPAGEPQLERAGVWIVVPCYRVSGRVLRVLEKIPPWVEGVICVDDACPEKSGEHVEAHVRDPRVSVLKLPANQGVGGATLAGYEVAIARGARILVKVDGDDQMDLAYLSQLVAPILLGEADYAKGNRFSSLSHLQAMPRVRIWGNAGLSLLAKASSGYWGIFEPTNGYTAIEASVARLVLKRGVARRYFFETDLLYHLGVFRAVVRDVPMPARYGDEDSNLRIASVVGSFAFRHLSNFVRRIVGQYFVRDFNVASIELLAGSASLLFGIGYALRWLMIRDPGQAASAGVVMTAALPVILGAQLLLQAINFDALNAPTRPIHPYLRAVERIEHS